MATIRVSGESEGGGGILSGRRTSLVEMDGNEWWMVNGSFFSPIRLSDGSLTSKSDVSSIYE